MEGEQFFLAVQLIRHRPLRHEDSAFEEFLMDLCNTARLLRA